MQNTTRRLLGKLSLGAVIGGSMVAMACGGDDDPIITGGTGGAATGGTAPISTGGTMTTPTTGGGGNTTPTPPGMSTAVGTPIPSGNLTVAMNGFAQDTVAGWSGYFFTSVDMGGSTISPTDFSMLSAAEVAEGKACAAGTVAQVMNMEYSTTWGANIGVNLNQAEDGLEMPLDVSSTDGMTFTVEAAVSSPMRFQVQLGTDSYCTAISPGKNTVLWTDLKKDCWESGGAAFDPTTQQVTNVTWAIPASDMKATPFDFCVGGISAAGQEPDGMGGAGGMGGSGQ